MDRRTAFNELFDKLQAEFIDEIRTYQMPDDAIDWITRMINHTVPGGKMNRGLSVVDSFLVLSGGKATEDELVKARVLGWCVEWLQAFFLVADDIMDQSITRRNKPCWYRVEGVGPTAINDSFILESAIYFYLKKYFRQEPYYVDLLELFHEVTLQTEIGQLLDLITAPEDHVDFTKFSLDKYKKIVLYKTAFYSFYLPVASAMRMSGITSETAYQQAKSVLLPLGEYFQTQDDYLDCYGDPEVIGKIGTDIEDNKCSWLINKALEKASPEQRKLLEENYGKKNADSVAVVKQIYKDLKLEESYKAYEEESYALVRKLIDQVDEKQVKHDVFIAFVDKIYKRTK
ncbi:8274_t:CDS:10 [Paraglomus occultum]|uniref:8274_t:CDS:1 n=1 Tax=Paraglomus occultum TaxID=144539 RepID=A0A9N8WM21_9GLOM|nr:8274_t:CDS:10 [Paraglomus occultum]